MRQQLHNLQENHRYGLKTLQKFQEHSSLEVCLFRDRKTMKKYFSRQDRNSQYELLCERLGAKILKTTENWTPNKDYSQINIAFIITSFLETCCFLRTPKEKNMFSENGLSSKQHFICKSTLFNYRLFTYRKKNCVSRFAHYCWNQLMQHCTYLYRISVWEPPQSLWCVKWFMGLFTKAQYGT